MMSRADKGKIAQWWWTIDKPMFAALVSLMAGGLILSLAASPPVAERIGVDSFHFVKRHALFLVPALAVMVGVSFLDKRNIRRLAIIALGLSVLALIATMFIGYEVKGARRWISLGVFSLQASEFVKPSFVVVTAWLFAENARRADIPGNLISIILFGSVLALLMAQPDLGQSVLLTIVWGAMFFMAGIPWLWIAGLGILASGGLLLAYVSLDHVAGRVDRFVTGAGDTFQVDTGREAIVRGGWLGQGPGEGAFKRILPDSHTDFVFAVAAEEFGIIICFALVLIFGFVVLRGLSQSMKEPDSFVRLSVAGLVMLFGFQSIINMAVNLQLMPAKGMTLPLISYGGSSLIALAFGMGMVLALTRLRAENWRHHDITVSGSAPQGAR